METLATDILIKESPMITISLPPDIEGPLTEAAQRQETTLELLALDGLRKLFGPAPASEEPTSEGATLFDFLAGHIGTVEGSTEAFSDNCGQRFAEGLAETQQRRRL
jgi:hypothetical protein